MLIIDVYLRRRIKNKRKFHPCDRVNKSYVIVVEIKNIELTGIDMIAV